LIRAVTTCSPYGPQANQAPDKGVDVQQLIESQ